MGAGDGWLIVYCWLALYVHPIRNLALGPCHRNPCGYSHHRRAGMSRGRPGRLQECGYSISETLSTAPCLQLDVVGVFVWSTRPPSGRDSTCPCNSLEIIFWTPPHPSDEQIPPEKASCSLALPAVTNLTLPCVGFPGWAVGSGVSAPTSYVNIFPWHRACSCGFWDAAHVVYQDRL